MTPDTPDVAEMVQGTVDRPVDEIVRSMMALITNGRVKGQFARDLEKLCAIAERLRARGGDYDAG